MMTRSKVEVYSHGLMVDSMMESGSMENNMEKVSIILQKEKSKEESGKMAKELNGLQMIDDEATTATTCSCVFSFYYSKSH